MLQLLKYEVYKKWKTLLIGLSIFVLAEGYILYELLLSKRWEGPLLVTSLLFGFGFFAVFIDSIFAYSRELNKKTGYMLFLTPRSSYKILGAKFIISFIEIIAAYSIFFLLTYMNFNVATDLFVKNKEIVNTFTEALGAEIPVLYVIASQGMSWFSSIAIAYFAVTASKTLLADKKFKGVISFVLFIVILLLNTYIASELVNIMSFESLRTQALTETTIFFIISVVIYFLSAYLLEKRVSL